MEIKSTDSNGIFLRCCKCLFEVGEYSLLLTVTVYWGMKCGVKRLQFVQNHANKKHCSLKIELRIKNESFASGSGQDRDGGGSDSLAFRS